MSQPLTIGGLSAATDTRPETIRYYEKIGLLAAPARSSSNYRTYRAADVARLRFVRRARELGFPIDQVRALLDLADQRGRDCATVDAITQAHLATIERKIADLTALKTTLADAIGACRGGTVADCRILEALAPRELGAPRAVLSAS